MKNGTSSFEFSILEDAVTLRVVINWDSNGEETIEEITMDDLDVTEEILSFGLYDKLVQYAIDHDDYFTSDRENHAEFCGDCERNGD